jgi:hypothetical protein
MVSLIFALGLASGPLAAGMIYDLTASCVHGRALRSDSIVGEFASLTSVPAEFGAAHAAGAACRSAGGPDLLTPD